MDSMDYNILNAILDLKVPYPKVDRIMDKVPLDGEELEARLGGMEMEGYVLTKRSDEISGPSLPGGTAAAGITNAGRRALSGGRW